MKKLLTKREITLERAKWRSECGFHHTGDSRQSTGRGSRQIPSKHGQQGDDNIRAASHSWRPIPENKYGLFARTQLSSCPQTTTK